MMQVFLEHDMISQIKSLIPKHSLLTKKYKEVQMDILFPPIMVHLSIYLSPFQFTAWPS